MKLKHVVWATAIWTLLGCGGSGVGLWYVTTHRVRGAGTEERAKRLGMGAGTLMAIGYAAIWLPYAAAVGKRRREQKREVEARVAGKKHSRRAHDEDE
jgi:hypothetical protein